MSLSNTGVLQSLNFSEVGITDGLVGWWPLNGTAKDLSGNANNGTVSGATVASGLNGLCYSFDGVDDYISTNLSMKNVDKTISFFIKKASIVGTGSSIISQWYAPASWQIHIPANVGFINYYSYNGSTSSSIVSSKNVCDNIWHHAVITYVASSNLLSIYIDGIFDTSANLTVEENTTSGNGIWFGRENGSTVYSPFAGSLEDVRIYNRALSADEVNILYELGNTANKVKQSKNTIYIKGEFNEML